MGLRFWLPLGVSGISFSDAQTWAFAWAELILALLQDCLLRSGRVSHFYHKFYFIDLLI